MGAAIGTSPAKGQRVNLSQLWYIASAAPWRALSQASITSFGPPARSITTPSAMIAMAKVILLSVAAPEVLMTELSSGRWRGIETDTTKVRDSCPYFSGHCRVSVFR